MHCSRSPDFELQLCSHARPLQDRPIVNVSLNSASVDVLHTQLLNLLHAQQTHTRLRLGLQNCALVSIPPQSGSNLLKVLTFEDPLNALLATRAQPK
jgi:hypothetical protein